MCVCVCLIKWDRCFVSAHSVVDSFKFLYISLEFLFERENAAYI